jgi:hypothetical protein
MIDVSVKNESADGKLYEVKSEKNTFRGYIEDSEFLCVEFQLGDSSLFEEDLREIFEEEDLDKISIVHRLDVAKELLTDYDEALREIDGRETELIELNEKLLGLV